MKPTLQAYDELQRAYDHFNNELFDGVLPERSEYTAISKTFMPHSFLDLVSTSNCRLPFKVTLPNGGHQ